MTRLAHPHHVAAGLGARVFAPAATVLGEVEVVTLDLDGLEALRLADLVGLYHEAAAAHMGVSRATFGRVVSEARRRVADALVHGKALQVGGGDVIESEDQPIPCPVHTPGRRQGRGCLCPGSESNPEHKVEPVLRSPLGESNTQKGMDPTGNMRAGSRARARICRSRVLVPGGRQT